VTRRVLIPLQLAAACAVGFGVLMALAYAPGPPRTLDASALQGFAALQHTGLAAYAERVIPIGDPAQVVLIGAALAAVAVARGRPLLALGVVGLLAGTSVGSQSLKALLAHPRPDSFTGIAHLYPGSFPSGHSTAAMALALAGVMVAPPRLRPLAAVVGGAVALAMGFSVVLLGAHFPSDVVGGYLFAAGASLCVVAALRSAEARWPAASGRRLVSGVTKGIAEAGVATVGVTGAVVVGIVALMGLARLPQIADYAQQHPAMALVAPAMAAASAVVVGGVTLALRRR
jgi:membrane-associated phospholipid phosphatase